MSDAVKPPGGGNSKYVIIGVLLLLGAMGVAVMLSQKEEPAAEPEPPPAAPQEVERVNPMAQPDLILEDDEEEVEDAGVEEPAEEPKTKKARPSAARDSWDCSGDLDRAALQTVIRQHRAQVRTCYERRLKVNNLLQGDVSLKIKVGANGKVVATTASGSLTDPEVISCMKRQAQSWKFPSPTGGKCAVIAVPFQFSPKN